jgi:small subunit ribosomal protein S17
METKKVKKTFTGTVVSNKMAKTLVVRVERTAVHPKYGKRYVQSKKYHVHDETMARKEGDVVEFVACRPYSRTKRWRVLNKVTA